MSLASIFLKLGAKGIGKAAKTAGKEILKEGGKEVLKQATKDKGKKPSDAEKLWLEMQEAEKAGDLDKYNRLRQIYDRMPKSVKKEGERNIVSRDEMQEALGMTPRDAIIRAGTRTLSNGVSAAGKIVYNNSYRLAQALLGGLGGRVPASKREAFGAGVFDAPANVAANKILKNGENVQTVTDAVSSTLDQNLDDYISQQNLLNSMMYAQNFDDSRGAYDVFARTISNSKRPSNGGIVSSSRRPPDGPTTVPVKDKHQMNI